MHDVRQPLLDVQQFEFAIQIMYKFGTRRENIEQKKLEKPLMLLKKKSFQTCVNYLGIYYEIITYAAQHVLVIWHMIVQNCGYLHMGCFQWTPQAAQSVREFKKELRLHFFCWDSEIFLS